MSSAYEIRLKDGGYVNGRIEHEFILGIADKEVKEGDLFGTYIVIESDETVDIEREKISTKGVKSTVKEPVRVITITTNLKKRVLNEQEAT